MYNYKQFSIKEYDIVHTAGLGLGQTLPDSTLLTLDGQAKRISDYLSKPIILETGSITCGMFGGQIHAMNSLAKEFSDFNFLLLYVREAHPGSRIGAHANLGEKCDLAQRMQGEDGIEHRQIVVDDLNGSLHTLLGALPNMVFLIGEDGKIAFKSDWNDAKKLRKAMRLYQVQKSSVPNTWAMLPTPNLWQEYRVFKRAGWDAAWDFAVSLPGLVFSHLLSGLCGRFPSVC